MGVFAIKRPLLDNVFGFPTFLHVHRTFNWEILLPDIWWGIFVPGLAVSKYCQAVKFGQYNISDMIEMKAGTFVNFFPTSMHIENVSATFITPVPDLVSLYFQKWKSLIIDEQGFWSVASRYKKNIYVVLYDRTGIPCNIIVLKGAFPIRFPAYNLTYEGQDVTRFEIEFKVDRVRMGVKAASEFLGELGGVVGKVSQGVGSSIGGLVEGVKKVAGSIF